MWNYVYCFFTIFDASEEIAEQDLVSRGPLPLSLRSSAELLARAELRADTVPTQIANGWGRF